MDGYLRKDAHEITGISASSIQLYTDRKVVTPDIEAPTGKGFARRYSKTNLLELQVIQALGARGVKLQTIGEIFGLIRKNPGLMKDFNPEGKHLANGRLYLIVYDHDTPEKMKVHFSWHPDPDEPRFEMKGLSEEQGEKIRIGKHRPMVVMKDRRGAIVIDVKALWEEIAHKV